MNARRLVPLILCTVLIIGASAHAQVPREWNRKITAISITPQSLGDSFFDIYFYRLHAAGRSETLKMTLLK